MKLRLDPFVPLLAAAHSPASHAAMIDVFARADSSSGTGAAMGVLHASGEAFSVSVDQNDLWNAGALPRSSCSPVALVSPSLAVGATDRGTEFTPAFTSGDEVRRRYQYRGE